MHCRIIRPGRALALCLLTAGACHHPPSRPSPRPSCGGEEREEKGAPAVTLELDVPPRVMAGHVVPIRLTLTNRSHHALHLRFGGASGDARAMPYDIAITRQADGASIWERMRGVVIADVGNAAVLAPGDSLTFAARWSQQTNAGAIVPPGTYCVRGLLPVEVVDEPAGSMATLGGGPWRLASEPRALYVAPP